MMGADSAGRRLLFPRALPSIPVINGGKDHERKRKIAVKCLELEEMLERQGHSQTEIETKVASFRALLLRQVTSINNNGSDNTHSDNNASLEDEEDEDGKKENGRSWSEAEASDSRQSDRSEKKKEKKKKKRPKHSKARKKKESRRRRLSSPSYSDYEPENPFLRNKRRKELVEDTRSASKVSNSKKDKKKKKRKHSVSRSRSSSRSRKSRYEAKNTKKKTKRRRSSESEDNSGCSSSEKKRSVSRNGAKSMKVNGISNDTADKREENRVATIIEKKDGSRKSSKKERKLEIPVTASSIFDQEATDQGLETSAACDLDSQYLEAGGCSSNQFADNEGDRDSGRIIFSRIEDIPTQSENPRFVNIADSKIEDEVGNGRKSEDVEGCSYTKLKFEINFLNKKPNLAAKPLSTFAELSNKLGPTVNLNSRKLPPPLNQKPFSNDISANKSSENGFHFTDEKEKNAVKENGFVFDVASANTVAEDMDLDDEDEDVGNVISVNQEIEDDEIVILKTSKSRSKSRSPSRSRSRSRSRSYSYSRSRSRSYSYSSYSRSRSRGYSYSRSRSRSRSYSYSSYSSRSRSRTRSRSPSIPRRRGSPSFLDKRRITSARKRPIPYHRATPPTSPSSSDYESSDEERSPVRAKKNQSK